MEKTILLFGVTGMTGHHILTQILNLSSSSSLKYKIAKILIFTINKIEIYFLFFLLIFLFIFSFKVIVVGIV